jgi:hypothetical protein
MLSDQCAGGACVIEVDVAEEEMPDVGERDAVVGQPLLQRRNGCRRTAVEERETVSSLEQVAADDALGAEVVEVD